MFSDWGKWFYTKWIYFGGEDLSSFCFVNICFDPDPISKGLVDNNGENILLFNTLSSVFPSPTSTHGQRQNIILKTHLFLEHGLYITKIS